MSHDDWIDLGFCLLVSFVGSVAIAIILWFVREM